MTTKKEISDVQIDKDSVTFGQYLNTLPKKTIKLFHPIEEIRKLEAQEEQGKKVNYPTELFVLNGYRFEIRKGVEVEVPEPIAQMAKDAGYC